MMPAVADRFPLLTAPAARDRTLPVHPALTALVPHLQRGATIGCTGPAAVSLALAVAAGPSLAGAWVGLAGLPGLGAGAVAECDVALERLVLVVDPPASTGERPGDQRQRDQRQRDQRWGEAVAAMIDGFDVVVLGGAVGVRSGTARRLQARAHTRGVVLVVVGEQPAFACDLHLRGGQPTWIGLGHGHGVVRARRMQVEAGGRRLPRPRRAEVWLPAEHGRPAAAEVHDGVGAALVPMADLRRTG
jgi:hypothetical protein